MNWQSTLTPPENGTRFVALHCDGGGAGVYLLDDDGVLWDGHGDYCGKPDDEWLMDVGFCAWAPLPDGMKLFFEGAGE